MAMMAFVTCFISYMLRSSMSIIILGMVNPTHTTNGANVTALPDVSFEPKPFSVNIYRFDLHFQYGPRYDWSSTEQSMMLGAYFWGYLITQLPGGILAQWIGPRYVVGYALLISGLITLATPFAADFSFWAVYVLRILVGLIGVSLSGSSEVSRIDNSSLTISFLRVSFIPPCITWCQDGCHQMRKENLSLEWWVDHLSEQWSHSHWLAYWWNRTDGLGRSMFRPW